MQGATAQAANTCERPVHPQFTFRIPMDALAVPISPPTMACVVEMGMPYRVATVRKVDDANTVHIMASRRTGGEESYW